MSIDATRSEGNTDKLHGYVEGLVDGQKRGMEIMKIYACNEFIKILGEICPEMVKTEDDIKAMENVFRKRLEE
jgi:hypothetical protein